MNALSLCSLARSKCVVKFCEHCDLHCSRRALYLLFAVRLNRVFVKRCDVYCIKLNNHVAFRVFWNLHIIMDHRVGCIVFNDNSGLHHLRQQQGVERCNVTAPNISGEGFSWLHGFIIGWDVVAENGQSVSQKQRPRGSAVCDNRNDCFHVGISSHRVITVSNSCVICPRFSSRILPSTSMCIL